MATAKEETLIQASGEGQAKVHTTKPAAIVTPRQLVTSSLPAVTRPAESKPACAQGKPAYEAFCLSSAPQRYLEIRQRFPEPAECPPNTLITNIRFEWRFGQSIAIVYSKTMLVEIKGKRLEPLFQAMKECKVAWIAEFDPQTFAPPLDDNAPYIKSIIVLTHRPETPPPMNKRH